MSVLKPENIKYLVVHCSATSSNMNIGVKEINEWHRARGWDEIGYHLVIRRDTGTLGGLIEYGRSLTKIGAHVKSYNSVSLGICMVGGVDESNKPENNFTDDQFVALTKTLSFLTAIFPKAKVQGHRDFSGVYKACPCFNVQDWWNKKVFTHSLMDTPKPILADVFEG